MQCLDAIEYQAEKGNGVIDMTELEKAAVKAARKQFAESLMDIERDTGVELMKHFSDRRLDGTHIDQIITAVWDGCRNAVKDETEKLRSQPLLDDEIPF